MSAAALAPRASRSSDLVALAAARLDSRFARELARDEVTDLATSSRLRWMVGDPHPSKILATKSEGADRLGELYDRMLAGDLDLSGFVQKRKDAVLSLPRWIRPADGSAQAKEIADFCHAWLSQIPDLATNLQHQLDSRAKGIAIDELIWERLARGPWAGAWVPVALIDRPMWRFLFRDGELHVRKPLGTDSIAAPPGKFLVMRFGTKDSPWGKALLDDCYWAWWLKKNGLKFYATYLDKWAQPTAKGTYRRTKDATENQKNQTALLEVLERIQTEYGIVLPEGLDVALIEAQRSGSATYEQFVALLTRSMAVKWLGEVDTSGAAKGPGSFAKAKVADDVRKEKVELDARDLAAHLKDNLLRPVVELNYGLDAPVPRWEIDTIEVADRELRADGISNALEVGLEVPRRYAYLTFQVPEPVDGEPVVEPRKAPEPAPFPAPPPAGDPPPVPEPEPQDDPEGDDPPEPAAASAPKKASRRERQRAASAHTRSPEGATPSPATTPQALLFEADPDAEEESALAERRLAELEEVADFFSKRTVAYYGDWRERLVGLFASGAVGERRALRELAGAINPMANARDLETSMIHGIGFGLKHLAEDLGVETLRLAANDDWKNALTPTAAIDYWSQLLSLPKDVFSQLSDSARRTAFTVAGVNDMALLVGIHQLIGRAIVEGWVERQFVQELDALFEKAGVAPLAPWHAALVYNNNVRSAMNLVRYYQTVLNPAARRLNPYLKWMSLDDGRVRPEHAAMSGYVAGVDHEIWKTWWPPAGHNCRCYILTINLAKARRLGYTGAEPIGPWPTFEGAHVLPDDGFRGAPDLGRQAEDNEQKARETYREAKQTGDVDLIQALLQLFLQLFGVNPDDIPSFFSMLRAPEKAA